MKVAALILAGGRSVRMGTDKGLLLKDGKRWIDIVKEKIPKGIDVFLSVGEHNHSEYLKYASGNIIVDKKGLEDFVGGVRALFSAKQQLKEYDFVLVLACDMINIKVSSLELLISSKQTACFKVFDQIEPVPFLITKSDLSAMKTETCINISLKKFLKSLDCTVINTKAVGFNNYNSKEDVV